MLSHRVNEASSPPIDPSLLISECTEYIEMGNLHGQGFGDLLCATAAEAPLDPGSSRPAPGGALCGLRLPRGIVLARHRLRVGWRSLLLLPRTLPIQRWVPMTRANFPLRTTQETQVFLTKNSSVLTCHSWEPLSPWALLGPVPIWGPDVLLWASRLTVIRVLSFNHLLSFVISSHQHISGHPLENSGCPLDAMQFSAGGAQTTRVKLVSLDPLGLFPSQELTNWAFNVIMILYKIISSSGFRGGRCHGIGRLEAGEEVEELDQGWGNAQPRALTLAPLKAAAVVLTAANETLHLGQQLRFHIIQ